MLIATALTLSICWIASSMLGDLIAQNRDKILAALVGRSWAAEGLSAKRQTTARLVRPLGPKAPVKLPAELRAAA